MTIRKENLATCVDISESHLRPQSWPLAFVKLSTKGHSGERLSNKGNYLRKAEHCNGNRHIVISMSIFKEVKIRGCLFVKTKMRRITEDTVEQQSLA